MQFMLLFSRQGKLRLQKWYVAHQDKLKKKITRELITTILARKPKMCSFLEWKDCKIVYKRCVGCSRSLFSSLSNFSTFQIREFVLLLCSGAGWQRAADARDHSPLRGASGQIFRQRKFRQLPTSPTWWKLSHFRCANSTSSSTLRKLTSSWTSCWWAERFRRRPRRTCWKPSQLRTCYRR